jgi:hypothetical protein
MLPGLVASTVLYGLPKTKTFEVRQMIRSNSTNVRIFSPRDLPADAASFTLNAALPRGAGVAFKACRFSAGPARPEAAAYQAFQTCRRTVTMSVIEGKAELPVEHPDF